MLSVLISFISGLALALAFPRTNAYPLAWIALAPLFYFSVRRGWGMALMCGFTFGLGFFGALLYWIGVFGVLPWILLAILQALYIAAFALTARLIAGRLGGWGRLIVLPSLWTAFEWTRTLGLLGFTWGDVGYSQAQVLPVVQIASLTGVWGVSFVVAVVNAALADAFGIWVKSRSLSGSYPRIAAAMAVALVVIGYGVASMHTPVHGKPVRAAVVQGNINQDTDEDLDYYDRSLDTYARMTREAGSKGAELIVWPETAMPGFPGSEPYLQRWLAVLSERADAQLIVGGRDQDRQGSVYNSAFLVAGERGVVGRYAKVRLVPFGEFVPARGYLPLLDNYRVTPIDMTPGRGFNLLEGGPCRVGVAICFESIFPYISRTLTASGAEVLCVITNDTWFGRTAAAEQHAQMSVLRAVENRRYVLRGAATGVSCIIDPRGRVLDHLQIFREGTVSAQVRGIRGRTFYTRHGEWFVYAVLVVVAVASVSAALGRRHPNTRFEVKP